MPEVRFESTLTLSEVKMLFCDSFLNHSAIGDHPGDGSNAI